MQRRKEIHFFKQFAQDMYTDNVNISKKVFLENMDKTVVQIYNN